MVYWLNESGAAILGIGSPDPPEFEQGVVRGRRAGRGVVD